MSGYRSGMAQEKPGHPTDKQDSLLTHRILWWKCAI